MSFSFSSALGTLQQVPLSTLTFSALGTLVSGALGTSYNQLSAPFHHSTRDVFTSPNDLASAFGTFTSFGVRCLHILPMIQHLPSTRDVFTSPNDSASFGACDVFTSPQ
ncbi:hypothetical protein L3X38_009904 [Prunus dulcis]|uniref:Uncharacterized protein n=1 Tax=Prunus dulcis TaxID=3755 RepID=A0AAD4WER8_PRUDU|nr:hypothetical protein L3X38_009904 [Prunus dulcis]